MKLRFRETWSGRCLVIAVLLVATLFTARLARGEEPPPPQPPPAELSVAARQPLKMTADDRYGMTVEFGKSYEPNLDIDFALVSLFALYDYGSFWHQLRPKELRFKLEGTLGSSFTPRVRAITSMGMMALYYFEGLATPSVMPYFEAGIGVIFTDFRVQGQGLRFNFNPQLGVGFEFPREHGGNGLVALRLHHLSNGGLYHENRGISSVILQVGRYF